MKFRILNFLIALDQFVYVVITLGAGMPDETMSAAAYRGERMGKWFGRLLRPIIDHLFWFDDNHCKGAYDAEVKRLQLPPGGYQ